MLRLMAYASFRQFIDALDKAGELTRVALPVETDLLISEWANREMKSPGGGKALLFENPTIDGKPSKFPVAINTMGSERRMAMSLQVNTIEDVAQENTKLKNFDIARLVDNTFIRQVQRER